MTDPLEFQSLFRELKIQLAIAGTGDFYASFAWLQLPNLSLFEATEKLPRVAYLALPGDRALLTFSTRADPAPRWNGVELGSADIVFHGLGERSHQITSGPVRWAGIAVAPNYLDKQSALLVGKATRVPSKGRVIRSPRASLRELRRVHFNACQLAKTKARPLAHPQIVKVIEEEITSLLVNCINVDPSTHLSPQPERYGPIVAGFSDLLIASDGARLAIGDLAASIGTSERTLRTSCAEILHMSPVHYEQLWRFNKARQYLLRSETARDPIAKIAGKFGFSEAGRFAVQYRKLFGELPSTTRKRAMGAG